MSSEDKGVMGKVWGELSNSPLQYRTYDRTEQRGRGLGDGHLVQYYLPLWFAGFSTVSILGIQLCSTLIHWDKPCMNPCYFYLYDPIIDQPLMKQVMLQKYALWQNSLNCVYVQV